MKAKNKLFDLVTKVVFPLYRLSGGIATNRSCVPKRFLLIKPDHLGDVVLTTPAIEGLRRHYPSAEIWYLAKDSVKDILAGNPALDRIVAFNAPWCCRPGEAAWSWARVTNFSRTLRRMGFDCAIAFQDSPHSNLFMALCGIPRRIGYAPRGGRHLLTDCLPDPSPDVHAAITHHRLVEVVGATEPIGATQIYLSAQERTQARTLLQERIGSTGDFLAFHLGAAIASKRTTARRAAALCHGLYKRFGLTVLLLVGAHEREHLNEVTALLADVTADHRRSSASTPFPSLSSLSLRELAAVIANAQAFVGHDSGPAHVACAVGTPTVVLFGPGNPQRWRPWGDRVVIARSDGCQAPCRGKPRHERCAAFEALSTDSVLDAVQEVLESEDCGH